MKDTVVLWIIKVIISVFVVVSTKMKKDSVLVDFQKLKKVIVLVFVKHLTPETLMTIVVVKKLILTYFILILLVMNSGLVVNVLDTCKKVGMMSTVLYIVVVTKDTKYSTGVSSIIILLLIDVKSLVMIQMLLL